MARGKGFAGLIEVLPLGYDDAVFLPGDQSLDDDELVLGLFGRLVPEKGVGDAVEILARVNRARPARLVVVGSGPEAAVARARAAALGLADRLELLSWRPASELADIYRRTHVVLVPSRPTTTWVEQFGRVIVEAQASGAVVAGYASGAIPEVAGEPAILTDVGAVAELGDRVAALVSDPAGYAERRAQGIELSRTRTWAQRRRPPGRALPPRRRRRRSPLGAAVIATQAARARPRRIRADGPDDGGRATIRSPAAAARRAPVRTRSPGCSTRAPSSPRAHASRDAEVRSTGPRGRRRALSPQCARA